MRRLALLASGVLMLSGLLIFSPAGVTPAEAGPQDGIGWQYSESANGFYRQPTGDAPGGGGDGGPATVRVEWGSTPGGELQCPEANPAYACEGDPGAFITGILCGAETGPRGLPSFPWIRYERDIGAGGEPGLWIGREADCDEPNEDDFVPMQEISYEVNYRVFQPLGEPELALNPNPKGLVNLPVIVSTDYPEGLGPPAELLSLDPVRVRIPIHIDRPGGGLDGEILAGANFTWTFQGGGVVSGPDQRGKPYTRAVDPTRDGGYYVTNTFGTTGTKNVHLNVEWTGTVTVDLLEPEQIDPVDIDADATVNVVQSDPVLTR